MQPTTKIKRSPEQIAEEQAIHDHYKAHPIREVPKTAIKSQSFNALLTLLLEFRKARESQGLSLEDVARRMGIDPADLSKLENAKELEPTIPTLFRWAEVLGRKLTVDLGPDA